MKQIPLTKGQFALVDNEDYDRLVAMGKWYAQKSGNTFYAKGYIFNENGDKVLTLMHRVVLSAKKGVQVDHINTDGLDNRKCNLRGCSHAENQRNRERYSNNKSGYKGVSWDKVNGKWRAQIKNKNKTEYIGIFENPIEAAKAYNNAALKYHGEFARVNDLNTVGKQS